MTEKEREEMWKIIGRILENLDRLDKMGERIDKLLEAQREQKKRLDRLIESQERINELFELQEQAESIGKDLRMYSLLVYGAIAGIHISENLKNLFEKRGFFVIEHKKGFKSKDYSV